MSNGTKEPAAMKPLEARNIIREVYGERSQVKAAADFRRGEVTMSRWLSGTTPIDGMTALLFRLVLVLHRRRVNWRKWLHDYEAAPPGKVTMEDII